MGVYIHRQYCLIGSGQKGIPVVTRKLTLQNYTIHGTHKLLYLNYSYTVHSLYKDLANFQYHPAPPAGSKSLTLCRSDTAQLCLCSQEGCNTTQNWTCPLRGQPGPMAKQHHFGSPQCHRAGPISCREIPTLRSNHPLSPQFC